MPSLFQAIEQLEEQERQDFAAWLSNLKKKEQITVKAELAESTSERLRFILSLPENQRITLFNVKTSIIDDADGYLEPLIKTGEDIAKQQRVEIN